MKKLLISVDLVSLESGCVPAGPPQMYGVNSWPRCLQHSVCYIVPSIGWPTAGGGRLDWDGFFSVCVCVCGGVDTETLSSQCHLRNAGLTPDRHTRRPQRCHGNRIQEYRGITEWCVPIGKPGKGQNFKRECSGSWRGTEQNGNKWIDTLITWGSIC